MASPKKGTDRPGFAELSVVRTRRVVRLQSGESVAAGTIGAVVLVHREGEAYEIEFLEPAGLAVVSASDLDAVE